MLLSGTKHTRAPAWLATAAFVAAMAIGSADATAMQVMESRPSAQAVMDGAGTQFYVRFDAPVDHAASRLTIVQDGRVVQTLRPRLNSQPNVLYAGVGRLAHGMYLLHWATHAMQGHDAAEGDIPFSVR